MLINTGFRNSEYYPDPTAAIAIANVMRESRMPFERSLQEEWLKKGDAVFRVQDPIRNRDPEQEKWHDLCIRIITQAAEDYRKASRVRRKANQPAAEKTMREIEAFFLSDWFLQMTNVDGEKILKKLQKEAGR